MKLHKFDVVSFVFGIMFLGLGLTAIFGDEDVTFLEARWVWPAALVVAGLAIVAFTARRAPTRDVTENARYDPIE